MADSRQHSQHELSSLDSISASSRVFGIPELLENVLSQLPARDLLLCECINKTWHAVIKKSNTLQEKLFYKCDPVALHDDMDESDLEINPFFLLVQRRWACRTSTVDGAKGWKDFDYPEASWKKMYLSRPAVWTIGLQEEDVHFIQSDGFKMHHLRGQDLTKFSFTDWTEDVFIELTNYGHVVPDGCPKTSLRQFTDMYVDPEELARYLERFAAPSDLTAED